MERLHDMLVNYNSTSIPICSRNKWSKQFLEPVFPKYWEAVYEILKMQNRNKRIIEIGCGQGDITSIACYLDFKHVIAYERDYLMGSVAQKKILSLFGKTNIIRHEQFPQCKEHADILILVNCVYPDEATTKDEYQDKIMFFYNYAGRPSLFILEVIDSSYTNEDNDFPAFIRLNTDDIIAMFPNAIISSCETYSYPQNKKSKRLYIIEINEDSNSN